MKDHDIAALALNARTRGLHFRYLRFDDWAHRALRIPPWWRWTIPLWYGISGRAMAERSDRLRW